MNRQSGSMLIQAMLSAVLAVMVIAGAVELFYSIHRNQHQQQRIWQQQETLWLLSHFFKQQAESAKLGWCQRAVEITQRWLDPDVQDIGFLGLHYYISPDQYDRKLNRGGSGRAQGGVLVMQQTHHHCQNAFSWRQGAERVALTCPYTFKRRQWVVIQDCHHWALAVIKGVSRWRGHQWLTLSHALPFAFPFGADVSLFQRQAFYLGSNSEGQTALYMQTNHGSRQEVATTPYLYWHVQPLGEGLWVQLGWHQQDAVSKIRQVDIALW